MAGTKGDRAFLDNFSDPGIGRSRDVEDKMRKKVSKQQAHRASRLHKTVQVDAWLFVPVLLLVASGLVMVGSSSIAIAESHGVSN